MSARRALARRVASFGHAWRGLAGVVATQPNARIHALAAAAVVALAGWLGLSRADWALLLLCIGGVFAAEAGNTAIEALADRVAPGPHPLVRRAKDSAAAAVLLAALAAAAVGGLVLGPPLWARLSAGG